MIFRRDLYYFPDFRFYIFFKQCQCCHYNLINPINSVNLFPNKPNHHFRISDVSPFVRH